MFVKTRQFAIARWRHAARAPLALPHANDNHRIPASHLRRRPLACHWREAADGRLECRWQIDRVDLSAADDPDLCWRSERVWRAHDNHLPLEGETKADSGGLCRFSPHTGRVIVCGRVLSPLPSSERSSARQRGRVRGRAINSAFVMWRAPSPHPSPARGEGEGMIICHDPAHKGRGRGRRGAACDDVVLQGRVPRAA
jgi:hypothetical protein